MREDILIISTAASAGECARSMAADLGVRVDLAAGRRAGLRALRRAEFAVVVVEESLAEADPEWADQIWRLAGLAMPVLANFAISGCARLAREVKAALARRLAETAAAQRAAAIEIEIDLRSSVTGLLLESELALQEPALPAALEPRLRHMVELAGALRERLQGEGKQAVLARVAGVG